jgi:hypothetical protein
MRLLGANGNVVELHIAQWEFPNRSENRYEQWIWVEGSVASPRGDWRFRDPCLLVEEAEALADWLEGVAAGATRTDEPLDFTEPNLAFVLTARSPDTVTIRVVFEHEARPPWRRRRTAHGSWSLDRERLGLGQDYWSLHDWWVQLDGLSPQQLRRAAAALREELADLLGGARLGE